MFICYEEEKVICSMAAQLLKSCTHANIYLTQTQSSLVSVAVGSVQGLVCARRHPIEHLALGWLA